MSIPKQIAHYVCSTHWDREWYQSFQDFRYRLVNMLDEVLEVMKRDQEFRYFHSDGQAILIEDYLEIRPERENEIRELAEAGRLRIGPWYVLPDEFLSSGESLVRNLQFGLEVAGRYGRPSRAGFVCDIFGHCAQLPQILRGFSIDNAQLFRGTGESKHGGVFRWQAPDGSEVLVYRFHQSYGQYSNWVRLTNEADKPFQIEEGLDGLRRLIELEKKRCGKLPLLLFDGADHMELEPQTSKLLRRANETFNDVQIVHSHLDGFVEDLREQRDKITRVIQGELRDPCALHEEAFLNPGVLSSRIPLKQANAGCENELCLWAEPFAAFAHPLGRPYPHQYLHVAWRHLLSNHPHDSLCGCSIDQVHKDMVYRFEQARQIARRQAAETLRHVAARVSHPELGEKDFLLVVFNAADEAVDGPAELTLRFPEGTDSTFFEGYGYENKIGFRLFTPDGREIPYQRLAQRMGRKGFSRRPRKFPRPETWHEVDVCAPLQVPPYGYATLICRPAEKGEPTRYLGTMLTDEHTMENEHLRVSVQSNGTISLNDKRNNQTYAGLLTFEEGADIGDGWYYSPPVNDQVFSSAAAGADMAVVADGLGKTTLKVAVTMNVPREFNFGQMQRSAETTPLRITSYLTLRRGGRRLEVRTVVENTVRDHRLRVLLPTGAKAKTYFADGAFDVIERPIALREDRAASTEMEEENRPQYTWTAVCDGQPGRGLAVVSTGLPESAVRDQPGRPIALTLLRSFFKTVFTDGEDGGEILGTHEFNYWIVPLPGALPRTELCRLGRQLAAGLRVVQIEPGDLQSVKGAGTLPPSQSFFTSPPKQAVVTAVYRQRENDALLLRMFNPHDAAVTENLALAQPVNAVELTDLEGKAKKSLPVAQGRFTVPLGPKQIVTLRIS